MFVEGDRPVRPHSDGTKHDEHIPLEDLDLRALPPMQGVLERRRVQREASLQVLEVARLGIHDVDPDEHAFLVPERLAPSRIEGLAACLPVTVEARGDHRGSLSNRISQGARDTAAR